MQVQSLCWEDPLEEEITYSWIIPWTEEPWWATVPGVTKSWTRLKQLNTAQHSTTPFRMPPSGSVAKNLPANAGDVGPNPGSGRSPGEGNGNPLQYSCLENPMDRGAWQATVHGVTKSRTQLNDFTLPLGFPGGSASKESVCNVGDLGSILG